MSILLCCQQSEGWFRTCVTVNSSSSSQLAGSVLLAHYMPLQAGESCRKSSVAHDAIPNVDGIVRDDDQWLPRPMQLNATQQATVQSTRVNVLGVFGMPQATWVVTWPCHFQRRKRLLHLMHDLLFQASHCSNYSDSEESGRLVCLESRAMPRDRRLLIQRPWNLC